MTTIRITNPSGMVPRLGKRSLAPNQAQIAFNCILTSGELRAANAARLAAVSGLVDVASFYRLVNNATGAEHWLAFAADTDITTGPIADSADQRLYYTSAAYEPRITNLAMATAGTPKPYSWYVLGVTPPLTAPAISVAGGVAPTETRAYCYTFVTSWGEESAPSPAGSATGNANGTWTVGSMDVAPPNSYAISAASWSGGTLSLTFDSVFGLRVGEHVTVAGLLPTSLNTSLQVASINTATKVVGFTVADPGVITDQIGTATRDAPHNTAGMTKRIYRSTAGTYFLVKEVAVATVSTADDQALSTTQLPGVRYEMPPATMRGLIALPNGIMAGFVGKQIRFCEPFKPHAWPVEYEITVVNDVVGLGSTGSSVVVATNGKPVVITGVHPDSMSTEEVDEAWPCLSKRGIASSAQGVTYPTAHGQAMIGPGIRAIVTEALYKAEEWEALAPSTFVGVMNEGRYVVGYAPTANSGFMLFFNPSEQAALTAANIRVSALYSDRANGKLYYASSGGIYEWQGEPGVRMVYDYLSKEFIMPRDITLSAARVGAAFTLTADQIAAFEAAMAAAIALNIAIIAAGSEGGALGVDEFGVLEISGSWLSEIPANTEIVNFSLLSDGVVVFSKRVTSSKPFRVKCGRHRSYAVRVSGNVPVYEIAAADAMDGVKT